MTWMRRIISATGAAAVITAAAMGPAAAETSHETTPETPKTNADLPIVNTYRGSDHIKPNTLNPRPVCNPWEDYRTVVYEVKDDFAPVGTISTTNRTNGTIPLTQQTSKTQTVSITVNGQRTETTSINGGGTGTGDKGSINAGISYSLAKQIGGEASYSLSWEVGQTVGPYDVPAGQTGEATYGFRTITMTGTQQYCKLDGTWSTPTSWTALNPIKNEVQVRLYGNPADSAKN